MTVHEKLDYLIAKCISNPEQLLINGTFSGYQNTMRMEYITNDYKTLSIKNFTMSAMCLGDYHEYIYGYKEGVETILYHRTGYRDTTDHFVNVSLDISEYDTILITFNPSSNVGGATCTINELLFK